MKIDRLIGIITVLLQQEKVTAAYLAQRFEVSKRTISRDIEDICRAGVPVVTLQGANGGITLADGYRIDKTVFTQEELRDIFAGLAGLDSVAQDRNYRGIAEKFGKSGLDAGGHILIDLSSHYRDTLAPKIEAIRRAIDGGTKIGFTYCSAGGEREVVLEPSLIVFQWSSWYVLGYDGARAAFRLFKLNRLRGLRSTQEPFEARQIPEEALDFQGRFADGFRAVVCFDAAVKYRLVEEYGPDCYETLPDGRLRAALPFTDREYLITWVLGFGDRAELLEPRALRGELRARLEKSLNFYAE